jgi:hypothetical protein
LQIGSILNIKILKVIDIMEGLIANEIEDYDGICWALKKRED